MGCHHKGSVLLVFLVAVIITVTSNDQDSTAQWNSIVDVVLEHVKGEQLQRDRQELELKDVEHDIDKKFAFVRLRGSLNAEGGWLRDVTTAYRVGDVTTQREGSVLKVTGTVSWRELRLGYRHYRLDIFRVIEGELEVNARSNAVRAVFSFENANGECRTKVDKLSIVDLSDFEVKITGLGFLNFLAEQIVKWFVDSRRDDITSKLEELFAKDVPEYLEGFHCDEYAALFMVPI